MTEDFSPPAVVDAEVITGAVTIEGAPSLEPPKAEPQSFFQFLQQTKFLGRDIKIVAVETEDGHMYLTVVEEDGFTTAENGDRFKNHKCLGQFYVTNDAPNQVITVAAPGPLKGEGAAE